MTSEEALKLAILEYEKDLETDENNQWVKNVLKGLKKCQQDLEVLEMLKAILYRITDYNDFNLSFTFYLDFETYNKIKEWLKND